MNIKAASLMNSLIKDAAFINCKFHFIRNEVP